MSSWPIMRLLRPVFISQPGADLDVLPDLLLQPFPEETAVTRLSHVGEDCVLLDRLHGVEVGFL